MWEATDESALTLLKPWKQVFEPKDWSSLAALHHAEARRSPGDASNRSIQSILIHSSRLEVGDHARPRRVHHDARATLFPQVARGGKWSRRATSTGRSRPVVHGMEDGLFRRASSHERMRAAERRPGHDESSHHGRGRRRAPRRRPAARRAQRRRSVNPRIRRTRAR